MRTATLLALLGMPLACQPGGAAPGTDSGADSAPAAALPSPASGAHPRAQRAWQRAQFVPTGPGTLLARPRRGVRAEVDASGLVVRSGADALGLATVAYGGEALGQPAVTLHDCAPLAPAAARCPAGAGMAHEQLTEWWTSAPSGLRHGWTLRGPLESEDLVTIEVRPTVGALLDVDPDGRSATFTGSTGRLWRYTGLAAWDADGVDLPARLEPHGGDLRVVVDVAGARWPVTVDPALGTERKITASDGAAGDAFGDRLSLAADVDGDGYQDLVVGAPYHDDTADDAGAAYVYYGSSTGLSMATEQELLASDGQRYDSFGFAVSSGGDFDGDGYDDVVVGAPNDDDSSANAGAAYVYYGSSTGLSAAREQKLVASDGAVYDYFGVAVACAGDVDGDGYSDLVVGAFGDSDHGTRTGSAYVYYGSSTGIMASSEQKLVASDGDLQSWYGRELAAGGDLNGDGFSDLAVAAYQARVSGMPSAGAAYVYYGSVSGIVTSSEQKLVSPNVGSHEDFGRSLSIGGDVDADGYDDLIVGQPLEDSPAARAGAAYVFHGSSTGIAEGSVQQLLASSGDTDDRLGIRVAIVGDVDADGYDDVAVSSDRDGGGGASSGAALLYFGSSAGIVAATEEVLVPSDSAAYGNFSRGFGAGGDMDGDGVDDLVVAAFGDPGLGTDAGAVYVYPGVCTDEDGDGSCAKDDCDDDDASRHPAATEVVGDGVDQDCDGGEVCYADADDDGYTDGSTTVTSADADCEDAGEGTDTDPTGECDDSDATVHPGATEGVGDEVDQDCDGTETCYADADDDGYTDGSATVASADTDCADSGEGTSADPTGECDDADATIHPGATEGVGDEVDSDCDGGETCYADADDDGYVDGSTTVTSADVDCTDPGEGTADDDTGECDDTDATVHPGATERVGDEVDQDCDGAERCFDDADADGYTDRSGTVVSTDADCADAGEAAADTPVGDCDDSDATVHPGATEGPGDEVDQDCDGGEICFADADDDGYTDGSTGVVSEDSDCGDAGEGRASDPTGDCDDQDATIHPGATDAPADGVDADCDGLETCYADADRDGYTDGSSTVTSSDDDCADAGEADAAVPTGDCDDTDPRVHPGATDAPGDGVDADCDGVELCFVDADDDGFLDGDGAATVASADADCADPGEGTDGDPIGDCDDSDATVNPHVAERPGDEVDSDCDGREICYADADDDGFPVVDDTVASDDPDCGDAGEGTGAELTAAGAGDCDESDATIHPGATEVEDDGIDQDCDGRDATGEPAVADDADKGGSCATAPGPARSWLLLAGLLALFRRRPRSPRPRPTAAARPGSR